MVPRPDFSREVYCVLGLPFDALDMDGVVRQVADSAASRTPCFLSTPNLNFLVGAQTDAAFRDSVINSDISIADGMPIVWMARLLGIPLRERVAGSDLFERLRTLRSTRPLKVYFFGGPGGVAERACNRLNETSSGLQCVGFKYPGFVSVEEMCSDGNIAEINASDADFLVVSLGAKKGQAFIERIRERLDVPVVSHLGAVVNFIAGEVRRAPRWTHRLGMEWLWRIKEEPGLWRRYFNDGLAFLRLLSLRVLPYAWFKFWNKPEKRDIEQSDFSITDNGSHLTLHLKGAWLAGNLGPLRAGLSDLMMDKKAIRIDLTDVAHVDAAFMGLLLLLSGSCLRSGSCLIVSDPRPGVRKVFRYCSTEFLLDPVMESDAACHPCR